MRMAEVNLLAFRVADLSGILVLTGQVGVRSLGSRRMETFPPAMLVFRVTLYTIPCNESTKRQAGARDS